MGILNGPEGERCNMCRQLFLSQSFWKRVVALTCFEILQEVTVSCEVRLRGRPEMEIPHHALVIRTESRLLGV
jgi:hypothetical protein